MKRSSIEPLRHGFTLVELLVVISIIGVLVGLLLPAVMSAMEAGRRAQCLNNIKQLALAMHNYENANRQFPTNWGSTSSVGTATSGTGVTTVGQSWLTVILPYIEETALSQQIALRDPNGKMPPMSYVASGYNNPIALITVVKTFICPSDISRGAATNQKLGVTGLLATTNYKAVAGCNWIVNLDQSSQLTDPQLPPPFVISGVPSPDPVAGKGDVSWPRGRNSTIPTSQALDFGNGIICRGGGPQTDTSTLKRPIGAPIITTMADIRDGTSHTFAIGESITGGCPWSVWFWFDGSTATCGLPLNAYHQSLNVTPEDPSFSGNWQLCYGFMSRHKGGANFALCDGSGRFIPESVDLTVYRSMATINGQETVNLPE